MTVPLEQSWDPPPASSPLTQASSNAVCEKPGLGTAWAAGPPLWLRAQQGCSLSSRRAYFSRLCFRRELDSEEAQLWFSAPGKSERPVVKAVAAHDCCGNKRGEFWLLHAQPCTDCSLPLTRTLPLATPHTPVQIILLLPCVDTTSTLSFHIIRAPGEL